MSLLRLIIVGSTIFCAATAASAFQEQRHGAPSAAAPAAELAVPQAAEPRPSTAPGSTDVRIPGLGKLGQLPRMDFGLELLYGAAEGNKPSAPVAPRDDARDDDLTIRGTVRHKF